MSSSGSSRTTHLNHSLLLSLLLPPFLPFCLALAPLPFLTLTFLLLSLSPDLEVQVEVIRIKNRLDPAHNAARSAGYRDVALNLRVMCAAARRLGVDTHVCEVQLLLRKFADLKVASRPTSSATITPLHGHCLDRLNDRCRAPQKPLSLDELDQVYY